MPEEFYAQADAFFSTGAMTGPFHSRAVNAFISEIRGLMSREVQ
jgi:hypothetical protein